MNTTARQLRQLISSNESYYAPIVEQARRECKLLCETFRDQPEWISGWGHQFACPECVRI